MWITVVIGALVAHAQPAARAPTRWCLPHEIEAPAGVPICESPTNRVIRSQVSLLERVDGTPMPACEEVAGFDPTNPMAASLSEIVEVCAVSPDRCKEVFATATHWTMVRTLYSGRIDDRWMPAFVRYLRGAARDFDCISFSGPPFTRGAYWEQICRIAAPELRRAIPGCRRSERRGEP